MPDGAPPVWIPRRMTASDGQNIAGCGSLLLAAFVVLFFVLLIVIGAWSVVEWLAGLVWQALNV